MATGPGFTCQSEPSRGLQQSALLTDCEQLLQHPSAIIVVLHDGHGVLPSPVLQVLDLCPLRLLPIRRRLGARDVLEELAAGFRAGLVAGGIEQGTFIRGLPIDDLAPFVDSELGVGFGARCAGPGAGGSAGAWRRVSPGAVGGLGCIGSLVKCRRLGRKMLELARTRRRVLGRSKLRCQCCAGEAGDIRNQACGQDYQKQGATDGKGSPG